MPRHDGKSSGTQRQVFDKRLSFHWLLFKFINRFDRIQSNRLHWATITPCKDSIYHSNPGSKLPLHQFTQSVTEVKTVKIICQTAFSRSFGFSEMYHRAYTHRTNPLAIFKS